MTNRGSDGIEGIYGVSEADEIEMGMHYVDGMPDHYPGGKPNDCPQCPHTEHWPRIVVDGQGLCEDCDTTVIWDADAGAFLIPKEV
jgi:hypothetical protein